MGDSSRLPEPARRRLEQAHLVVGFMADQDIAWFANVRKVAPGAEVVTIDPRPSAGATRHVSEHLLDQLLPWPAVQSATAQMVGWINRDGLRLPRQQRLDMLVHPGSGGRKKCWPVERFAQLVEQLREQGRRVAIVLGEVESERLSAHEMDRLSAIAEVYQPATCVELLHHLLSSRAFIGNDSGPAHLAGMLGLNTICLFGPTDPRTWRPLGPRVKVLRHQPLNELPVERVIEASGQWRESL